MDADGAFGNTTFTLEVNTSSNAGHSTVRTGTLTSETVEKTDSSSSSSRSELVVTLPDGSTYTVVNYSRSSSTLDDGNGLKAMFARAIDANGNAVGDTTIGGGGSYTRVNVSESEYQHTGDDTHTDGTTTTTYTVDNANTTEDTVFAQTVNLNNGTNDPPDNWSNSNTYTTDSNNVQNDANAQANEPSAAGVTNNGTGTAIGAVDAEFGPGAGSDIGLVGTGTGSAILAGSSTGSGDYMTTGPLENGGYWERYDDGISWWYAEYDASGNQTHYESGNYITSGLSAAMTWMQDFADQAASNAPVMQATTQQQLSSNANNTVTNPTISGPLIVADKLGNVLYVDPEVERGTFGAIYDTFSDMQQSEAEAYERRGYNVIRLPITWGKEMSRAEALAAIASMNQGIGTGTGSATGSGSATSYEYDYIDVLPEPVPASGYGYLPAHEYDPGPRDWTDDALDRVDQISAGIANGVTGGLTSYVREKLYGEIATKNHQGGWYIGGNIVGGVMGFFIGGAASATKHVGWAYSAARGMTTISSVYGMGNAGYNIYSGNGSVWDVLELAPAVGTLVGKLTDGLGIFRCFTAETPVVTGYEETFVAGSHVSARDGNVVYFAIGGAILVGAVTLKSDDRKRKSQQRSDQLADDVGTDPGRDFEPDPNDDHTWTPQSGSRSEVAPADDGTPEIKEEIMTLISEPRPERIPEFSFAAQHDSSSEAQIDQEQRVISIPEKPAAQLEVSRETTSQTPDHEQRLTVRSRLKSLVMFSMMVIGAMFIWNSLPSAPTASAVSTDSGTASKYETTAISDIRLGERVLAHNPITSDTDRNSPEPEPQTWREVRMEMRKPDGSSLEICLLRPLEWLESNEIVAGTTVNLDYAEFGAAGEARVLDVLPCPEIESGEGEVVTGRFVHSSGDILDIFVEGELQPIGSTGNHRWWSEDRQDYVEARELRRGERLRTVDGTLNQVASISQRTRPERVFNLEVNREHVYHVGTSGMLVHNSYRKAVVIGEDMDRVKEAARDLQAQGIGFFSDYRG